MPTLIEQLQVIKASAAQNVAALDSVIAQQQSYKVFAEALADSTVKTRTLRRIEAIIKQLQITKGDFTRQITGINMSITDLGGNVEVLPPVMPPSTVPWSTGDW